MNENESQSTITEQLSTTIPVRPKLSESYTDVNKLDVAGYGNSGKSLNEYLKDLVINELSSDGSSWEIIEEREEFRPTSYILNPRHIKTFVAKNETNAQRLFAFDVEGYA